MVLDVEGIPEAVKVLADAGLSVLSDEQLYNL